MTINEHVKDQHLELFFVNIVYALHKTKLVNQLISLSYKEKH